MHDASYDRVIETKDICAPVLDSPTDLSCFQQFLRLVVIFLKSWSKIDGNGALFRNLIGPEFIRSNSDLADVTKLILLTKRGLSELDSDFQFQLLNTLFQNLTKEKPSGRFGSHWEEIGFQGIIQLLSIRH